MKLFRRLGALGRFLILAIVCVAGSPALCQTSPSNPLTATLVDSSGNPVSYTNVVTVQPNLTNATFSNSGAFDQLLGNSGDVSGYNFVSMYLSSVGSTGAISLYISNDCSNYTLAWMDDTNRVSAGSPYQTISGHTYYGSLAGAKCAKLHSTYTSGTTAGSVSLSSMSPPPLQSCLDINTQQIPGNSSCPMTIVMGQYDPTVATSVITGQESKVRVGSRRGLYTSFTPGDPADGWTEASVNLTAVANIDANPGLLGCYHLWNNNATWVYVQFFNLAATSVTLGTTAPQFTVGIPPNGVRDVEGHGTIFSTAIAWAVTTTPTGSTFVGSNTVGGYACFH